MYLDKLGRCLCPACANDPECEVGPAVRTGVHWEGAVIECEGCGGGIESAYGSPEEDGERDLEGHSE